jgi:hypothetical protein
MTDRMAEWIAIRAQEDWLRLQMAGAALLALAWYQIPRLFPAGRPRNLAYAAWRAIGVIGYAGLFILALWTLLVAAGFYR